jgi:peptidoglycan/xylan/chitin deacetylase (PgdA/CDA1 family)
MKLMDRFRSRCLVLLYHRIARVDPDPWSLCVTPEHFADHLDVLRSFRPVRLDEIGASGWSLGNGGLSVAITFDDGYADNLREAARLLMLFDTPATFFLATGYMGNTREFWWDELERIVFSCQRNRDRDIFQFSAGSLNLLCDPDAPVDWTYFDTYEKLQPLDHDMRRRILDRLLEWACLTTQGRESHRSMTAEEIVRLGSLGLFEIGAHTVTHPVLAAQPLDSQYKELGASKTWLEELLEKPVASFSYPYGGSNHYTSRTVRAVADSGFARACSTCSRPVNRTDSLYELPRFTVTDMNGEQFERLLFS